MRILVTGSEGMLAGDLIPILATDCDCYGKSRETLDITDAERVFETVEGCDVVVNCAAYTAVDLAETQRELAMLVNGIGVQNLVLACEAHGVPLCHISTDYVFDGSKGSPYTPFDNACPVNFYGESKLAGERYVRWLTRRFYIIRTSWLYGTRGNNFVKTMLRLSGQRDEVRVVSDQIGSPTSTVSLAWAIKAIIRSRRYGVYHVTDQTDGKLSWYDFACEIMRLTGTGTRVIPITTADYPTAARRPVYSVLDLEASRLSVDYPIKSWDVALADCLRDMPKV
ncbi:dTDP-4-dehydrorhamnose reductase [Candidatus Magnetobacterium casense]|uniref:dTDP-4-dehydrorhamnose reductase n=1 Tax=Candidatus Magnetobacterium casense TaxID=1455061 RepID=A0ABS6S1D9_9BACT|nr:dTDP-4-dehydrorhamnose reductase [Candidatus Magnetobacterium casensis]MBV6342660.1 dTDP-4-dehydrorhamnose reductase [Candidatus Magnetobacterium casensis]